MTTSTTQALLEKGLMIKEINMSIDIMKKIFKLNEMYFLTDVSEPADEQCIKIGFRWAGYNLYLYIGAGFVKAIGNDGDTHLCEYRLPLNGISLGVAAQRVVTNLYDNINKHVQAKLTTNSSKSQKGTNPNEGGENIYA